MLTERIANGRYAIASWAIYLGWAVYLFNFGVFARVAALAGGLPFPEERFDYNVGELREFFERLGPDGIRQYSEFQIIDCFHAFFLSVAFFLTFVYFAKRFEKPRVIRVLLLLPVLSILLELVEDFTLRSMANGFPEQSAELILIVSKVTAAKLISAMIAFLAVVVLGAASIVKFFSDRKHLNAS